jgi:NAD(P)H dehydrogenase (quinone)
MVASHKISTSTSKKGKVMYAVMGITGQVGGAVAEDLLANGERVRAVLRDASKAAKWKERGVEIAIADFDDAGSLEKAFRGVDGVFVMTPPNYAPEPGLPEVRSKIATLRKALAAARPGKAVYLSSVGAEKDHGLGLITGSHLLEELSDLPIPGAFLRAAWFMENAQWDVASAREGTLYSYLQPLERDFPLVATADIGRTASKVLRQKWEGARFIEVGGPKRYSPKDLAAAFAKAFGHEVKPVVVPRETWVETFVAQGTPADRTSYRVEMVDGFNSGWIDFGAPGTEHVTGTVELQDVITELTARA